MINSTFTGVKPWCLQMLLFTLLLSTAASGALAQAKQWDKTFGGFKNYFEDYWGTSSLQVIVPTPDGGYLLAGNSDADVYADKTAERKGGNDYWVIKIDEAGNKLWDKTFGGDGNDGLETIVASPGGGYLLGGFSYSYAGADKTEDSRGSADYWVVKIDESGTILWDKTFGGEEDDFLKAMIPTPDGGFLLGGYSYSGLGANKTEASRDTSTNYMYTSDFWLIKINGSGSKIWDKTIGGSAKDNLQSLALAADGGFLIGGSSTSGLSGEKSQERWGSNINEDYWIVKVNETGTKIWDKTIGGNGIDVLAAIAPTADGGYLLGGSSDSDIMAGKTAANKGGADFWVVKILGNGTKVWDKTYGGRGNDKLKTIVQAINGSYLLGGSSTSGEGIDKSEVNRGEDDYWLVKTDTNGNKSWDKTFGGITGEGGIFGTDYGDFLNTVAPTADGGYLLGGTSDSNAGFDKSEDSKGFTDFWVVKIKEELPQATLALDNAYGGSEAEGFTTILNTTDGGYLLGGHSLSDNSGDKTQDGRGRNDFWIVKTDAAGRKLWDKRFGGTNHDYLNQIIATQDGGYLLAGSSRSSFSGDKSQDSRGGQDYWIVKVNSAGLKQWDRRFGGSGYDDLRKVAQLATGEYMLAGFSNSPAGGEKSQSSQGGRDYWILKISSIGNKLWDRRYGGNLDDNLESFVLLSDGGYVLAGSSASGISGDKSENSRGSYDYWLVQIDNKGNKLWDKRLGGSGADQLFAIGQTNTGDFYLAGHSNSGAIGDKSQNSQGGKDFWMIKVTNTGNKLWDTRFGGNKEEELRAFVPTSDGGYLLGGTSSSDISGDKSQASRGSSDYWIVKTSVNGAKLWDSRYGGSAAEELRAILPTNEGGYLLAGRSDSGISGDRRQPNQGSTDYWVVNLTAPNTQVNQKQSLQINQEPVSSLINPETEEQVSNHIPLKAYPNPFSERLSISLKLPTNQVVSLKIYDNKGREAGTLHQGEVKANKQYEYEWLPPQHQAAGLYLLRLTADNKTTQQKIVLVR